MLFMLAWRSCSGCGEQAHNKSLQVTFDPPRIFVTTKTAVASNAPELGRYVLKGNDGHV